MATTSFCLFMLVLTPWMANGRPAEEAVQPHSRDSRQMLLPYVPMYQPSFQNYGNPMGAMTPAAKRQLLQALLATSSALSSQSFDHSGFKTIPNQKNDETSVDSNSTTQEFDAGTLSEMDLQNMNLSPDILEQIDGRFSAEAIVGKIVQHLTTFAIQTLINVIFG